MNQLNQLKTNPAQFLLARKLNIPQEQMGSPQQMIEYMTGMQIPQEYASNPNGYFNYLLSNGQLTEQQQTQMRNAAQFFNF